MCNGKKRAVFIFKFEFRLAVLACVYTPSEIALSTGEYGEAGFYTYICITASRAAAVLTMADCKCGIYDCDPIRDPCTMKSVCEGSIIDVLPYGTIKDEI